MPVRMLHILQLDRIKEYIVWSMINADLGSLSLRVFSVDDRVKGSSRSSF